LGAIDVWINNAMVTVFSPLHDMAPDEFRRVTEVTYLGCVHGTMAALRQMRGHNCGVVIQVGSSLAYRGIPLQSAYCGAKHAIRGFTDSLRAELLHEKSGINCNGPAAGREYAAIRLGPHA
jgi:NAD(P)-dependent dehydrogenase (short-subunit alcohol dehydrogenase family)